MKRLQQITLLTLLGLIALLAASRFPAAPVAQLPGDPVMGGRIYDNWMVALDLEAPEGDQPLWGTQENNGSSGLATWLCSTCHGWDYKGAQGAYGPRSPFFSGFGGVGDAVGASQQSVLGWLDGSFSSQHNFTQYIDTTAANDLAAFLRTRQIDLDLVIDPDSGRALGSDEVGADWYREYCAQCHGNTGRSISFTQGSVATYLGDVAITDPWRTVHKIRFGLPEGNMPASEELGWSLGRVADLLAFLQTLPRGNNGLLMAQGEILAAGDIENQGDINPIVRAGLLLLALVLLPVAWDAYQEHISSRR